MIDARMHQWLSCMHMLALELNTGMTHSRGPILKAMHQRGFIDAPLRGTKANKRMVLAAMVDQMRDMDPDWNPSESVARALGD